MGFFNDLKQDLGQAVNELLPAEESLAQDGTEVQESEPEMLHEEYDMVDPELMQELDAILKAEETNLAQSKKGDSTMKASDTTNTIEMQYNEFVEKGVPTDETAVITKGMKITGDIDSNGSLELIGAILGNITIRGKLNVTGEIVGNSVAAEVFADSARITGEIRSDKSVKIGQSSIIIGNIEATSAVIAGAVKGDIDVKGPVVLDATAIVMGNIKSKSVQIHNGAVIEGMCSQCYADVNPTSFFEEVKKGK